MPSIIDLIVHPVSLAIMGMYLLLIAWERAMPARALPHVPAWRLRGLAAFAVYFVLSSYLPLLWTRYLLPFQLFDLTGLPLLAGIVVGVLVYQSCAYGWHRLLHGSDRMWRVFHQMHHSAERLDTSSVFWFSPLDMIGWTAVSSIALTVVVGLSAQAATGAMLFFTLIAMFTHTNVSTPRWLGYLIERPEMHSWHHARGLHRYNYSELPMFDLLFGTFSNPRDFAPATGFHDGGSARVIDLMLGRDVAGGQAIAADNPR